MEKWKHTFEANSLYKDSKGLISNDNMMNRNYLTLKSPEFSANKLYNIISNSSLASLHTCKTLSTLHNSNVQAIDNLNQNQYHNSQSKSNSINKNIDKNKNNNKNKNKNSITHKIGKILEFKEIKKENKCKYKLKRNNRNRKLSGWNQNSKRPSQYSKNQKDFEQKNSKFSNFSKFSKFSRLSQNYQNSQKSYFLKVKNQDDQDKNVKENEKQYKIAKREAAQFYLKKMNQIKFKNLMLEKERNRIQKKQYDTESKVIENSKGRKISSSSVKQIVNRLYNANHTIKEKVQNLRKSQEQKRKEEIKNYFHPLLETKNYFGTCNCKIGEEENAFESNNYKNNNNFKKTLENQGLGRNLLNKKQKTKANYQTNNLKIESEIRKNKSKNDKNKNKNKRSSIAYEVRKSDSVKSINQVRVSSVCDQFSSNKEDTCEDFLSIDSLKNKVSSNILIESNFNAIDLC